MVGGVIAILNLDWLDIMEEVELNQEIQNQTWEMVQRNIIYGMILGVGLKT